MMIKKKDNFKYIITGVWLIFLITYWDTTTGLISRFYTVFSNVAISEFIGLLAFSIWLLQFVCPMLFPVVFSNFFKTLLPSSSLEYLTESIFYILFKGIIRGIIFLLLLLLLFTSIHYWGAESLKDLIPSFTLMFDDRSINFVMPVETVGFLYTIITLFPMALAMVLPKIFLTIATFFSEIPMLAITVVTISIVHALWKRNNCQGSKKIKI